MKTKTVKKINRKKVCDNPSDIHGTPLEFFQAVNSIFKFTLDVCANKDNHKVSTYYSIKENGLKQPWHKDEGTANFGNIPFSDKEPWFSKAAEEAKGGAVIVLLTTMDSINSRSFNHKKPSHLFITKGRLKFEGHTQVFPKGIVLVIYNGDKVADLDKLDALTTAKGKQIGFLTNIGSSSVAA